MFMTILFIAYSVSLAYTSNMLPMPKGLENVYLGMSLNELKKVKPNIIRDDWPYSPLYFEKDLENEFFASVVYEFTEDRLSRITLSKTGNPDLIRSGLPGLIKGCIKKWGNNYSIKIGTGKRIKTQEIYHYPIFYWEKADAKIELIYFEKKYEIYIFDSKLEPTIKFRNPTDQKEIEDSLKDASTAEGFNGLIFE